MASKVYGVTPWGKWFAEAIEGYDESGRLSRGATYANTGKVVKLDFEGRSAIAKVKGHSSPWYKVRVDFPLLGKAAEKKLYDIIEADPLLLARIEAGELPEELIAKLKAAGVELIPRSWSSMKRSCSCPDWGDPCKHMAAVYYLIAQEIDRDPGLLFRLRGVDLAARFGGASSDLEILPPFALERRDPIAEPRAGSPPRAPRVTDDQASAVDEIAPAPGPLRLESYLGLVSSLIPKRPSFVEGDFGAVLVEFYHRAAAASPAATAVDSSRYESVSKGRATAHGDAYSLERRFASSRFRVEYEGQSLGAPYEVGCGRPLYLLELGEGGASRTLPFAEALSLFLSFEDERGTEAYRFLFYLSRIAFAAWRASAFVPAPALCDDGLALRVMWVPLPAAAELGRALDEVGRLDPGLFALGSRTKAGSLVSGASTARLLVSEYFEASVRALGFRPTGERSSQRALVGLLFEGASLDVVGPGDRLLPKAMAAWLSVFSLDFASSRYRYRFEIDEAPGAAGEEEASDMAQFAIGLSALVSGEEGAAPKMIPLQAAAKKLGDLEVLRVPTALSSYVPEILLLSTKKRVLLDEERLASFLGDAAPLLQRLGVEVVLPKALKKALSPRLVLDVKSAGARSLQSYLDLESALQFDWRVAIGDQLLAPADFEKLVKTKRGLVLFRDGFVRLDAAEVARLLERSKSAARPTALDLVAARLSGDARFSADAEALAASLFEAREESLPAALTAKLRPYQMGGYQWAMANLRAGLGCLLADDMGLGKTVQAIAVIARLAEEGLLDKGALVVAPAALLTNWERELERFAPSLRVSRYHGTKRALAETEQVAITTYETAARDSGELAERGFSLLVCDEAQLMKNASSKRSRGIKAISADRRLALSGTPVENRLEDLRSIFDFAFPGYLGSAAEFKARWRVPIELDRDAEAAEKLKRITSPFLLRRLKTDRAIIADLPDKVVVDEYARLTGEQAALYESVSRECLVQAQTAEPGPKLAAIVLKLLTSLKQICDHPRVYDKESPPAAKLSGKCLLLVELLREILELREKALVFSQYVETLELLQTILRDELGEDCLMYHGGLSKKARDAAVDAFQERGSSRVMLVSLKAGGLGLNLTAASRVIHYDLWYNPAVENQATDRAFRIGQTKNVFVHRLISAGTFEEKIDAMIKAKAELSDMTVASGESWLSKMSVDQLKELFEG